MSTLRSQSTFASHPDGCDCAECREWDHDEELGVADLEERLEAAFERRYEGEHRERGEPNKYGEKP